MARIQAKVLPDPEHGLLLIGSDDDQEEVVQQPTRSRWGRTAVALLVVGLVATVLVVGTVHDKMVPADAAHAQEKWGFGAAWDAASSAAATVSDAAGTVSDAASSAAGSVSAHAQNAAGAIGDHAQNAAGAIGDHAQNIASQVSTHAQNAAGAAGDAYNAAKDRAQAHVGKVQSKVCGVVLDKLPALKTRWVDKMSHDLFKPGNVCHENFKSQACKDEFLNDACNMKAGTDAALPVLCKHLFEPVVKKIQDKMDGLMTKTAVALKEPLLVKNSLSLELLALDDKAKQFCSESQE